MPRFAILEHDWPTLHWDFLLESGNVLLAWRLLTEPAIDRDIPAERNFDHRKLYLDYEGPLEGSRGSVTRWDSGEFEWLERGKDSFVIEMRGRRVRGRVKLVDSTWRWEHDTPPGERGT